VPTKSPALASARSARRGWLRGSTQAYRRGWAFIFSRRRQRVRLSERFPTRRSRVGVVLAFVGTGLAALGADMLSLLETSVPTCTWCDAYVSFSSVRYVPDWALALIVAGGVAPLLVLLRPKAWWAGAACALTVGGFFGEYFLFVASYTNVPYLVQPTWYLSLGAWVVLAGAVTSAVGMMLIRPATPISSPAAAGPVPSL